MGGVIGSHYSTSVGAFGGTAYYLPGHVTPQSPATWDGVRIAEGHTGGTIMGTTFGFFGAMAICLLFFFLTVKQAFFVLVLIGGGAIIGWIKASHIGTAEAYSSWILGCAFGGGMLLVGILCLDCLEGTRFDFWSW